MGKIKLFGFHVPRLFLLLAGLEVCLITGSVFVAALIRFNANLGEVDRALGPLAYHALVFGFIIVASLGAMGLYQLHFQEGFAGQLLRAVAAFLLGGVILALLYYLLPPLYIGRGVVALAFILSMLVIAVFRPLFFKLVDLDSLKPRVLVFGAGEKASWITKRMGQRTDRRGFRLVGFVDTGSPKVVETDAPIVKLNEPIHAYALRCNIDQIVIAMDERRKALPMDDLLQCRLAGIEVIELATFFERETGTVAMDLVDPSWLVFGGGFRRGLFLAATKRFLDVLLSIALMIFALPLILLTTLAIKFEDGLRAPVIYAQDRVGEKGRVFKLYKLRSMCVDAEHESGACWARSGDSRVTRVGRVIRKLRIDELPQIFNVLRGNMSFVGPRPERPEFTQSLERQIRYYRERSTVKPGLTGWAQLRYPYGASEADAGEKLRYDLFYIKNHNTVFDLLILLQTVEVVVFGKGAR